MLATAPQSSNLHIEVGELQEENFRLALLLIFLTIISQRYDLTHNLCYRPTTVIDYRLDGPGIESRWGRDFPHLSRPALGPTQPPVTMRTGSFLGVKSGRGVRLTPHPLLVPWSRKSRAIPLLPIWAVRPVQSLRAHFTTAPTTITFIKSTHAFSCECLSRNEIE